MLVKLLKRLKGQSGFTTVTLMGVLLTGGLLVMASFAAVNPDISQSRDDQDTKQAYAAAESGLQWYMNGLARDNVYYLKCDNPPPPSPTEVAPVNQKYTSGSFKWRRVPGEQSKYGIELIPAAGYSACSTTDQYSMIDSEGNMQLRVTGRSRDETRSIIATLRRQNFLDYIYFTHFETLDPAAYSDPVAAEAACAKYRPQRSGCQEIQFDDDDDVLGPFHTNDNIMVCGDTKFGENSRDRIEINGPTPWVNGGCGANPDIVGTLIHPAGELGMPPSNQELRNIAESNYRFVGKTKIELHGSTMTVTNDDLGWRGEQTMDLPPNGVIYVDNSSCTSSYDRTPDYNDWSEEGCGNVYVHGSYGGNLTIGAANDIIIDGNLTRASDDLLMGLVANNFVRVYHPCNNGTNGAGSITDLTINAAILALKHSFIVDNWGCGASLGRLNVDGAIAQYYRGPVGTTGGTGYLKRYTYNRRLRYREPPFFLDPQLASWRISRQSEQVPPMSNLP
jgi:hypothetical protein